MRPLPRLLSKTKMMRGYQCLKNIYWTIHEPSLEAPITPDQQALFDQGNEVGLEAQKRYPGGVCVDHSPWDFVGALKKTRELIAAGTSILYEAAFEFRGCYARADILRFNAETQRWTLVEVKSSTKVKSEQLDDVGLQTWIIANSGIRLEKICILHLNPQCEYPHLENLFAEVDVTAMLREKYLSIQPKVQKIFQTIQEPNVPRVEIGPHCFFPHECGFRDVCWKENKIPEFSVLDLPRLSDRKWELYRQGVIELSDPRLTGLNPLQERIVRIHSGKEESRWLDREGIQNALKAWKFPLVYLDFETTAPAIPRYPGCRPFSQTPFQWSVHVERELGGPLEHFEFLHEDSSDPRPTLIPALIQACGNEGSVVSYYAKFESDRITEMAAEFPEYRAQLQGLVTRMVDPLPIFRESVYDQGFEGSFSLKRVAPAILGQESSYSGMTVGDGGAAQRAFAEMIHPDCSPHRHRELREALLEYCKKDTAVMVELVRWLFCMADRGA